MKDVILTGIRSNEEPTIGNYLGAILPMVEMQRQYAGTYQINMFVPDLHSFTTPTNHQTLYQNTLHNLKYFIAAGIDIHDANTFLYRQSYISAHSELTWILDCFTYVGEMSRMTQFKDKSAEHTASVTMGLMNYPVLMASDILLYNARFVPVGEDQTQHLEIVRDIAIRFNNKFGDIFIVPEATKNQNKFIQRNDSLRIRSLTDPSKKMSKSCDDQKSKINLCDTPEQARKKIMSATTDSIGSIHFDWQNQPGITNLLQLLALLTDTPQAEVNATWEGQTQYGPLKTAVADAVSTFLEELTDKYQELADDQLLTIMSRNEAMMAEIANATLHRAQVAVGLRPR